MSIRSYQDLQVWQKAMDFAVRCYQITKSFPRDELYGLTSQIRRAASSISANIAEGQGRHHTKEFQHFLGIARGSTKEAESHLILSQRLDLITEEQLPPLMALTEEISRMLMGLYLSLEKKL